MSTLAQEAEGEGVGALVEEKRLSHEPQKAEAGPRNIPELAELFFAAAAGRQWHICH